MRIILILLLCICHFASGQQLPSFQQVRYDEDYSGLEKDTVKDWYHSLKYKKVGKGAYISFGGDFRSQYLIMDNEAWNPALKDNDGFMLTRWLLHADFHLSGKVRIFAELQSSLANSRKFLVPVEENPLEPHQLFVDYKPFYKLPLTFRVGRQEVTYGSQRLISLRDAPNNRRSFDGIKVLFNKNNIAADIFYLHAVIDKVGIFDDTFSNDLRLWGAFSGISLPKKNHNLNFYYLGFYNSRAIYNDGTGQETRHTLGARMFKNGSGWGYDLESACQFGLIGNRKIAAWSVALATSYSFTGLKYYPEIGLKADLISGDSNSADQKNQTLNPLFAPGAYFGLAAPIGPSNLMDVHPSVTLHFTKAITFICDYAFLWRYSRGDGIYRPNMVPFFKPGNADSRYIGSQISGTLICKPNRYISLMAGMSWFDCGGYLKEVSAGENILFGFASAQIKI